MLEAQRVAYLEALGITQYVALTPIAGALQLPVLEWEEACSTEEVQDSGADQVADNAIAEEAEAAVESATLISAVTKSDAQSDTDAAVGDERNSALGNQGIPELDLAKLGLRPATEKLPEAARQVEKLGPFSCLAVTLQAGLRILVQLSAADAPGLNAVEHRMLSDLLYSIGVQTMPDQRASRLYRWPVINNVRMAADPVAAKDAICAFLSAAEVASNTLIMGRQIGLALGLERTLEAQRITSLPGRYLVLPGFVELQADWKVKADVWPYINSFLSNAA